MEYKQKDFSKGELDTKKNKFAKKYQAPTKDIIVFSEDFQGDIYADKEKIKAK